jgi:hypothetical protein
MNPSLSLREYYANPPVRQRMREYCGGTPSRAVTAQFLAGIATPAEARRDWEHAPPRRPEEFDDLLDAGADLARSLWDTESLLVHFDLDYLNADYPGEPFLHPAEMFFKMEPVAAATRSVLHDLGLHPLVLMTGRGYHFTGRAPLASATVARLAALAPEVPGWFATTEDRVPGWLAGRMTERMARAYSGHGMVTEWLGHLAMRRAAASSPIPVVFDGTVVGAGVVGRECVSIDLSAAGDPLDVRHIRVAFGAYRRHELRPDIFGPRAAGLPPLVPLPMRPRDTWEHLVRSRDLAGAAALAAGSDARLPEVTRGLGRAVEGYRRSALAAFHRRFYAEPPDDPAAAAQRMRALDPRALPPCVAAALLTPNDLLLQPAQLQHLTRYLLMEGWHPRHVAGLVLGRYLAPLGWGDRWSRLDARTRAEFDVRVFAGMVETGLDRAIDFNCRSAQEKGLCPAPGCDHDLRVDRDRLLARVHS